MFDRARLLPMPADQGEVLFLPVRHDPNRFHRAAICKQLPLARTDTDGQRAADTGPILSMVAVLGHSGHLGPLAAHVGFRAIKLPGGLWEPRALGAQWRSHVGADGIADPALRRLTPGQAFLFIQRAVASDEALRHPRGQRGDGPLQNSHVAAACRNVPVAEFIVDDQVLLGPDDHHGLIAPRAVVRHCGCMLVGFQNRRIHIQRGGALRCQRSCNNPQMWSANSPHPLKEGGGDGA